MKNNWMVLIKEFLQMFVFALKPTVSKSASVADVCANGPANHLDQKLHRADRGATAFRTTKHGGPKWDIVTRRVTTDMESGESIEYLLIDGSNRQDLHGPIPLSPQDIRTTVRSREDRSVPVDVMMFVH